jgi:hypothetical protein
MINAEQGNERGFQMKIQSVLVPMLALGASLSAMADQNDNVNAPALAEMNNILFNGEKGVGDVQYFYIGKGKKGQSCLATISSEGSQGLSVSVQELGQNYNYYDEGFSIWVGDESRTDFKFARNLQGDPAGPSYPKQLRVDYSNFSTYDHETQKPQHVYYSSVTLGLTTRTPNQFANGLKSVAIRDFKPNEYDKLQSCGKLEKIMALPESEIDKLGPIAHRNYFKGEPEFVEPLSGMQYCTLISRSRLKCTFGLQTDYADDYLHAIFSVNDGKVGSLVGKVEFEPGC